VYDNGIGFDIDATKLGLGLSSLRNREILLNGKIQITSSIEMGTTITITVPYNALPINLSSDIDVAELQQRLDC
jgi:glucose-6-phosphate-specific signal transduction histidine kinase